MRHSLVVCVLMLPLLLGSVTIVQASGGGPPTPPPPPNCSSCSPPPPPPTPVATLAPTAAAAQPLVDVKLETSKVSRGQTEKISVAASANDQVTLTVRYRRGKAVVYHSKVGNSKTLVKSWKIPKNAPVGKAEIKIMVTGSSEFLESVTFTVTK